MPRYGLNKQHHEPTKPHKARRVKRAEKKRERREWKLATKRYL